MRGGGSRLETERPFYFVCGKCGCQGINRDGDCIACPICGNRYYGVVFGKARGQEPKKVYADPDKPPTKYESGHHETQRMENLLTGAELVRIKEKKGGEEVSKQGKCVECGREMTLIAKGLCGKCYLDYSKIHDEQIRVLNKKREGEGMTIGSVKYQDSQEIPLTIRLTIEVMVRVSTCQA